MSRQKRKGDGYEREIAKFLDEVIYGGVGNIQRAMLSGGGRNIGGGGMPDITGTPHVWVEAKRTEKFKPYEAMAQAEAGIQNTKSKDMPVVMQRRNQMATGESLCVMRLRDWEVLYRCFLWATGHETIDSNDEEYIEFFPEGDETSIKSRLQSSNLKLVVNNNGSKEKEETS